MKKLLLLLSVISALPLAAQKWSKNFDFVDQCICGLSLVGKDHKVGFADHDGNIIIPLIYDEGLTFNEGYTAVRTGSTWKYLDSTGKAITESVYEDAQPFHDGLAAVGKDGLYGYINTKGTVVIDFRFTNARGFAEGLAPVANKKGYWGFINTKGEIVINPQYDFADSFTSGEARILQDDKVFFIDKNNKKLHE